MTSLKQLLKKVENLQQLEDILKISPPHPQETQTQKNPTVNTLILKGYKTKLEIQTILLQGADENETRFEYMLVEHSPEDNKYHGTYSKGELKSMLKNINKPQLEPSI